MKNTVKITFIFMLAISMIFGSFSNVFADDVVEIGTLSELEDFADQVNSGAANYKDAVLTANIGSEEAPFRNRIGMPSKHYCGNFDGNGYTIYVDIDFTTASSYSNKCYAGVFGKCEGATISNLTVKGSVKGSDYVGGIVGKSDGTNIINCINYAEIKGTWYVGGICGYGMGGSIVNCSNYGTITAKKYNSGILGFEHPVNSPTQSNNYNEGYIVAGSLISSGSLWIAISVAAVAMVCIAVIITKKKRLAPSEK